MATNDPQIPAPAFPDRLRAQDPILAREDTNGLFQAFRARRLRGGKVMVYLRDNWEGLLTTFGALIYVYLSFNRITNPMVGVGIMWGMVFLRGALATARARSTGLMPRRIGEFFGLKMIGRLGALPRDLWLIPVSGAEVAVALYLEHRETIILRGAGSMVLSGTMLSLMYLYAFWPPLNQLWKEIFPLLAMALWVYCTNRRLMERAGASVAYRHVMAVAKRWEAGVLGKSIILDEQMRQTMKGMLVGAGIGLGFFALFFWGARLLPLAFRTSFLALVRSERPFAVGILILFMCLVVELIGRWRAYRRKALDFKLIEEKAAAYYEPYMRKELLGDE